MKKFNKILVLLIAFILCINFTTINSQAAASVTISLSTGSTSIGGSVSVTVSVSGIDSSSYYSYTLGYNSGILQYNSASSSAVVNGGGGSVYVTGQ
ncbi:MAG: hypothetical protein IJ053_00020, partial [Lachnospiraceae bacterium]|nr:hypothetical protein [Lachnospiraceae bacterium]